jgi:hypothetical protein
MIGYIRDANDLIEGAKYLVDNDFGWIHGNGIMQRKALGLLERVVGSVAVGSLETSMGAS